MLTSPVISTTCTRVPGMRFPDPRVQALLAACCALVTRSGPPASPAATCGSSSPPSWGKIPGTHSPAGGTAAVLGSPEPDGVLVCWWRFPLAPPVRPVPGQGGVIGGCPAAHRDVPDDLGPGELGEVGAGVPVAEHPSVLPGLVECAEVPGGDPASGLVRVRMPGPPVGDVPDMVVQAGEHPAGDHAPVVGRPVPVPWPSPRFREARHSLTRPSGRLSNDAAGFASCYGPHRRSPIRASDAGLRPGPFSRPSRQPATGPPGSYPDRTSTGRRRRAYEHEEHHERRHGVTSRSPGRTKRLSGLGKVGGLVTT